MELKNKKIISLILLANELNWRLEIPSRIDLIPTHIDEILERFKINILDKLKKDAINSSTDTNSK